MRVIYLFVLSILLTVLQTFLRSIGINFPLLPLLIFYAAYVYGPGFGVYLAFLSAFLLDFSGGWAHPFSLTGFLFTVLFAVFWLYRIESASIVILAIPGFLIPIIGDLPQNLLAGGFSLQNMMGSSADAIANGILGTVLFPFWIILLDFFGKKLGLKIYADAKERIRKESL